MIKERVVTEIMVGARVVARVRACECVCMCVFEEGREGGKMDEEKKRKVKCKFQRLRRHDPTERGFVSV